MSRGVDKVHAIDHLHIRLTAWKNITETGYSACRQRERERERERECVLWVLLPGGSLVAITPPSHAVATVWG